MPRCPLGVLTQRERDVLVEVAAGNSNVEIAAYEYGLVQPGPKSQAGRNHHI